MDSGLLKAELANQSSNNFFSFSRYMAPFRSLIKVPGRDTVSVLEPGAVANQQLHRQAGAQLLVSASSKLPDVMLCSKVD